MLGDNVTIKNIILYIPVKNPSPETEKFFNGAITKSFISSFKSWTTDREPVSNGREFQLDIGSASNINAPLYLIAAHQKTQRIDPADPTNIL